MEWQEFYSISLGVDLLCIAMLFTCICALADRAYIWLTRRSK